MSNNTFSSTTIVVLAAMFCLTVVAVTDSIMENKSSSRPEKPTEQEASDAN